MNHLSPKILESLAEGLAPSADQTAHLQSCKECAGHLEGLTKYFSLMKSLPRLKAPPGFPARLRARLEAESAVPGWKKFPAALFSTRRIPLQLAGAGFAALLLFWALPRQQNPVPQSETEAGKGRPLASPETLQAPIVIDLVTPEKSREAGKMEFRPETPRPSLPKKKASVKSELPKVPASRQAAAPALSKSESRAAPSMEESFKSPSDEPHAGASPSPASTRALSPPVSSNEQLRTLGFHKEIRRGREIHILRLAKSKADSVQARLKDLGWEKLLILHDLPGDSLEIEIR